MSGMVAYAIFAHGPAALEIARNQIDSTTARVVTRWGDFLAASIDVQAAVMILPELNERGRDRIVEFKERRPLLPVVLVTNGHASNSRLIAQLPVLAAVVYVEDLDENTNALSAALAAASGRGVLLRAHAIIMAREPVTIVTHAMAEACRRRAWTRTVHQLATTIGGYSESRFGELWRDEMPPGTTPHAFIEWLVTTRAVVEWQPPEKLAELARRTGIDPHTLPRRLRRRFGTSDLESIVARMPEIALGELRRLLGGP